MLQRRANRLHERGVRATAHDHQPLAIGHLA
jgi:hypothetical protein